MRVAGSMDRAKPACFDSDFKGLTAPVRIDLLRLENKTPQSHSSPGTVADEHER